MAIKRLNRTLIKAADLLIDEENNRLIKITFPYQFDFLDEIKALPGRKFNKEAKYWTLPLSLANCFKLRSLHYNFRPDLKEWANTAYLAHKNKKTDIEIPGLKGQLFPYQKEGVIFIENKQGKALIADEMGLGKTVQALAWLQLHPENRPALIICPASLKYQWKAMAEAWIDVKDIQVLNGTVRIPELSKDIIIINYDLIANKNFEDEQGKVKEKHYSGYLNYLQDLKINTVIIDEGHYIKSNDAKRTKATKRLCKNIPNRIILTGTPIEQKSSEIFNLVQIIDPSVFPNQWSFLHTYREPKNNGFGWTFNGATNTEKLHAILTDTVMIRRKKKDVLKDLPDKLFSFVPVEINNREEYQQAEDDFREYVGKLAIIDLRKLLHQMISNDLDSLIEVNDYKLAQLVEEKKNKAIPIVQIGMLKQLAAKGKLNATFEWIEDFLESGKKLVVFCEHRFIIDAFMEKFGKIAVKVDGSVSSANRQKAQESFQNDKKIKLFFGNRAAQEGLTLTAASDLLIFEYPWTPGALKQRTDRVHRISQKETVNIHYVMGLDTIDEKIARRLDEKAKILEAVLDGKTVDNTDLIGYLIDEYRK